MSDPRDKGGKSAAGGPKSWAEVVAGRTDAKPAVPPLSPPKKPAPPPNTSQPPPPSAVPQPAPKPSPAAAKPVQPCTSPIDRGWPLGFETEQQFQTCMDELYQACEDAGIDVKFVGVRGSAATYKSRNPGKKGQTFDSKGKGKSDIDAFIVTDQYLRHIRPSKVGFFHPDKINGEFPALKQWGDKWSKELGREITPGAFRPNAEAMKEEHIAY